jgi:hypothetical protein
VADHLGPDLDFSRKVVRVQLRIDRGNAWSYRSTPAATGVVGSGASSLVSKVNSLVSGWLTMLAAGLAFGS